MFGQAGIGLGIGPEVLCELGIIRPSGIPADLRNWRQGTNRATPRTAVCAPKHMAARVL
jgi:hypothetical protein